MSEEESYANVRLVQDIARAAEAHAARGGTPALGDMIGDLLDGLYGAVPSARALIAPPLSIMDVAHEMLARYPEAGGRLLTLPTRATFAAWTRGRLPYEDTLAASEEVAEALEPVADGHSSKALIRCSVIGGIAIGREATP